MSTKRDRGSKWQRRKSRATSSSKSRRGKQTRLRQLVAATQQMEPGTPTPVVITAYEDRSFTFVTKTPPAAYFLKKAAKIGKGSGVPNKDKVGQVTLAQVREIAETKLKDMNAVSVEAAMESIKGSARSMGITVVG